jgi:hypothetical protein
MSDFMGDSICLLVLSCLLVPKQKYKTGTRTESQKKIKANNRKHRTRAHAQTYDKINTNRRKKTQWEGAEGRDGEREEGTGKEEGREGGMTERGRGTEREGGTFWPPRGHRM